MEPIEPKPPEKPLWRFILERMASIQAHDPEEASKPLWVRAVAKYTPWVATVIVAIVVYLATDQQIPVTPLPQGVQVVPVQLAEGTAAGDEPPVVLSGWVRDPDAVQEVLPRLETPHFEDTPAGRAVMGDQDHAFLWQSLQQVSPNYRPTDQGPVGSCVGVGWKHTKDVALAVQIVVDRRREEFRPLSAEAIYGGSRVQIGGGRIRSDGSVGAWAAQWSEKYGMFPEARVGAYSASRAKQWGSAGVPPEYLDEIRQHPVKGVSLVRSWIDGKRALLQGYPIALCSDQGFAMQRGANGIARASGTWYHCMSLIGFSTIGGREYGFLLNSWGPRAHTGPVGPGNPPTEGFYADSAVIDRMLRQGDSFAVSNLQGFPQREIDWFAKRPERRLAPELELALAP